MTAMLSRFEIIRALQRQGVSRERAEKLAESQAAPIVADATPRTEHDEQVQLFSWTEHPTVRRCWPDLELLFAVPNFHGRLGRLTAKQGAYLRDEGRKPGVPDICLPVPRGQFHGLWIELKRVGGKPTDEQLAWRERLRAQGYRAEIVEGCSAARDLIIRYLNS